MSKFYNYVSQKYSDFSGNDLMCRILSFETDLDNLSTYFLSAVREFRRYTFLPMNSSLKCNDKLHLSLLNEECSELNAAKRRSEKADAYADIIIVAAGWYLDGFPPFEFRDIVRHLKELAGNDKINLKSAFDIAHKSNMTKVCYGEEEKETTEFLQKRAGLDVEFRESSKGVWACYSSKDQTREDGKEIPEGKLLKPVGFKEPDWMGDKSWRLD